MERRFPTEKFIRIWQNSGSLAEVARRCGMASSIASSRASYLRREGVALKTFRVGRKKEDMRRLSKIAKSSLKKRRR